MSKQMRALDYKKNIEPNLNIHLQLDQNIIKSKNKTDVWK